jgi:hypothetical protein
MSRSVDKVRPAGIPEHISFLDHILSHESRVSDTVPRAQLSICTAGDHPSDCVPPLHNSESNSPSLSMSNLQSILDAADKYAQQTGINLKDNPFADKVKGCDSPSAVLLLLQENLKEFKDYRDKNRKFIECVSPVVQFVHAFSGVLGEAAGLVSRNLSFRY